MVNFIIVICASVTLGAIAGAKVSESNEERAYRRGFEYGYCKGFSDGRLIKNDKG